MWLKTWVLYFLVIFINPMTLSDLQNQNMIYFDLSKWNKTTHYIREYLGNKWMLFISINFKKKFKQI